MAIQTELTRDSDLSTQAIQGMLSIYSKNLILIDHLAKNTQIEVECSEPCLKSPFQFSAMKEGYLDDKNLAEMSFAHNGEVAKSFFPVALGEQKSR